MSEFICLLSMIAPQVHDGSAKDPPPSYLSAGNYITGLCEVAWRETQSIPVRLGDASVSLIFYVVGILIITQSIMQNGDAQTTSGSVSGDFRPPVVRYPLGSTIKLEQLIGEKDKERHQPIGSRTVTRYRL
jgi:hypothetical protein